MYGFSTNRVWYTVILNNILTYEQLQACYKGIPMSIFRTYFHEVL